MNMEQFILPETEIAGSDMKGVMKCLLHTIMFHRALGPTPPHDSFVERYELSYVQCGDLELEKEINDKVEEFCVHLRDSRENMGQMRVLFYEKRQQNYFWKGLGFQDEKACWEEWVLGVRVISSEDAARRRPELADQYRDRVNDITQTVTNKMDHIPPVPKELTGTTTFYHEIKVLGEKASSAALQAFKGMSGAKLI